MAHFKKAQSHHAKIGAALTAGNARLAMQHTGHMMLALRATTPEPDADDQSQPQPTAQPRGIRGRLAGFMAAKPSANTPL